MTKGNSSGYEKSSETFINLFGAGSENVLGAAVKIRFCELFIVRSIRIQLRIRGDRSNRNQAGVECSRAFRDDP